MKRLFNNGVRKMYEGIILTSPFRTIYLIAALWSATLYQGKHDRKYKPGNIVSIGRYILRLQALPECCYIEMKSSQFGIWNHVFCRKVFVINWSCQFLDVCWDVRYNWLYLFYPLSLVLWDRCIQHSHQILIYLAREHHLYSRKYS